MTALPDNAIACIVKNGQAPVPHGRPAGRESGRFRDSRSHDVGMQYRDFRHAIVPTCSGLFRFFGGLAIRSAEDIANRTSRTSASRRGANRWAWWLALASGISDGFGPRDPAGGQDQKAGAVLGNTPGPLPSECAIQRLQDVRTSHRSLPAVIVSVPQSVYAPFRRCTGPRLATGSNSSACAVCTHRQL